jgi:hypothetical protein
VPSCRLSIHSGFLNLYTSILKVDTVCFSETSISAHKTTLSQPRRSVSVLIYP